MSTIYEPGFGGHIGRTHRDSTPWWPPLPEGLGKSNVVMIVLDDLGFAHFGSYGSTLATPHVDRLAAGGLRYTGFHTTALCSPTRAALLTGRNHHSVGIHFDAPLDELEVQIKEVAARQAALLGRKEST